MKEFFGIFTITFILFYFGMGLIFMNIWSMLVSIVLFITVTIKIFINQYIKIEELESRIRILESEDQIDK